MQGIYLFTDTVIGSYDEEMNTYPDVSIPPSQFDLSNLYNDPDILLKEGDLIRIEIIGAHDPGEGYSDSKSDRSSTNSSNMQAGLSNRHTIRFLSKWRAIC